MSAGTHGYNSVTRVWSVVVLYRDRGSGELITYALRCAGM